jgi:uncharacterized protein (TIGR01777 family)
MKKLVIAGGSGFLGRELAAYFKELNYNVVILTRGNAHDENGIKFVQWDASSIGNWTKELEGCDVLMNLTGKSVDCRYTDANKKEILRSRVDSTRILGQVLEGMENPPKLWMNSSTATIYRYSEDEEMTEYNGEYGNDFSMTVAKTWEAAFNESKLNQTRKVALRISLVLGKSGGVYPVLKRLAKFGVAGKMGSGKQRFAWVHIDELKSIAQYIIDHEAISGPVNCTVPGPITNKEFLKDLRKSIGVPFGIPQPKFLLKIGGVLLGTESELILKSRYAVPQVLLDAGYKFQYTEAPKALAQLAKKD